MLLDRQRELVDFLSDHLIRYDMLRQYEIEQAYGNLGLEAGSSSGTPDSCEAYGASGQSMGRPQSPKKGLGRGQGNAALDLQSQDRPQRSEGGASTELAPIVARSATSRADSSASWREGVVEAPQGTGPQVGSPSLAKGEVSPSREPLRGDASSPRSPYVVEPGWGFRSRRRISRFIDFDFVKPCYLKRLG